MIHRFDDPLPLDAATAARLLGGKGASLAHMTQMRLPVPPGFVLSTEVWRHYDAHGDLPGGLEAQIRSAVLDIASQVGASFGGPFDERAPLLLAVRSGGPTSMPGLLETVLDVGIGPAAAAALALRHASARFARDVRRRFIESYASVVFGVPLAAFDALLGGRDAVDLDADALEALIHEMEELVLHEAGQGVPEDPWEQLFGAIGGVLASWRAPRAHKFRDAHGIDHDEGTGVTVQAMVFGNLGERSGTGVVFSRNPSTGERRLFGEWLRRAQGDDVVSGRRTPWPLTSAQVRRGMEDRSLEVAMPEILEELTELCAQLEARYGDAVDVEITIENGRLYALQCRAAKRTAVASARMAVEMHRDGMLGRAQALARVEPGSLRQLLTPRLPDPESLAAAGLVPVARGLASSPGAATGRIVMDHEAAQTLGLDEELILVRAETSAEDVEAMRGVKGILTSAGGLTSHGAVVARALGKPCVTGATSLHVDYAARRLVDKVSGVALAEGEVITIDGTRGLVYAEPVAVEPAPASEHVETLLVWADEARRARVLAEAGSARLATIGRRFGADGIAAIGASSDPLLALLKAVEDDTLLHRADGEAGIRAALEVLRPDRDYLIVEPAELSLARSLRGDGALPIWTVGEAPRAEGRLVSTLDEILATPEGVALAFRADETSRDLLEAALAVERPVFVIAPPLDVPVGRLLAGQT